MTRDEKRALYGDGPWCDEPDRIEWRTHGYPCLMLRHPEMGHWCGYVGVPPTHPLHGRHFRTVNVMVHGGVNYAEPCLGDACHTPWPGEPHDVWWFGFDCAHFMDRRPGTEQLLRTLEAKYPSVPRIPPPPDIAALLVGEHYRDVDYVTAEVDALAHQLWSRR
jgi:hypothetical protein